MRKKIFVRAPCLSQSGYGEQSRFALRALRSREDLFEIFVQPIPWGKTGWVWRDDGFRQWLDSRVIQTQILLQQKTLSPDISLQITIPNEFQKICPTNIGFTAGIETTKVAPLWLQKGNDMDKILVVSQHAKDSYVNTSAVVEDPASGKEFPYILETPVVVTGEITPEEASEPIEGLELDFDFNFLMISQVSPRKNFVNSVKWWIEEFIDQEVGLIVKTNMANNSTKDLHRTEGVFKNLLSEYPDRKCKVYLLHGDLTAGQMSWLYTHNNIKALVNIAHGEGFGLPMFEAARAGLPIVTIGWSGQVDFLNHNGDNLFQKVKHVLKPVQEEAVWEGVIQKDSLWAFASQGSYKMVLRKTFKEWESTKETAEKLKNIIENEWNEEVMYERFCDAILNSTTVVEIDDKVIL